MFQVNRRSGSVAALLALAGTGVGVGNAQVIAYEGFAYPQGAAVLGQNGGVGFATAWQSAGYGAWSVGSSDSVYISGGLSLQTSGFKAQSGSGGFQRTIQLGTPLGSSPGSVWVSFVARQTSGSAANSWLGVKLPCTGSANPNLFLGKPFGQSNWGADAGLSGATQQTTAAASTQAFYVARIDFRAGADDVHIWINPGLSGTPADGAADLSLPAYGDFAGITKVLMETGASSGAVTGEVDEIRIGGTYADVAPVKPGLTVNGFEHTLVGSAQIVSSPDARRVPVRNLGSSGQDGIEIHPNTGMGIGTVIDPMADLTQPGVELRHRYKGWDGTIKGTLRISGNGAGATACVDLGDAPVEYYDIMMVDGAGHVISTSTLPGPICCTPWVPNFTCSNGATPVPVVRWVVLCNSCTPVLFVGWACPGEAEHASGDPHGMVIQPHVLPGVTFDPTVMSCEVSASGMPGFDVIGETLEMDGMGVTGLGSVRLDEKCDDGDSCGPSERRLPVHNIGSSGEDGVEVQLRGSPASHGSFSLGDVLSGQGSAECTVRSATGATLATLSATPNAAGGADIFPVFPGTGTVVTGYDGAGQVTGVLVLDPGQVLPLAQVICGPGRNPIFGWYTMWVWTNWPTTGSYQTLWGVIGCGSIFGGGGNNWPDTTVRFSFGPQDPTIGGDPASVSITGAALTEMALLDLGRDDSHPCTIDFNGDGFVDFFDYDDYVNCFESGTCSGGRTADFNGDGFVDFFDYDDFVAAFETGC